MPYYTNISNPELYYFHQIPVKNFTIKLSDINTTWLFKTEEIIEDTIYKIYPLFYTQEIKSSNQNDKILDNKCIICTKQENKETYLTFISNPDEEITDYISWAWFFEIGENLTTDQFNMIVSLLRQNTIHNDTFSILEETQGNYGQYLFNVDGCTIIDSGIVIDDETRQAGVSVKLMDNVFHYSTYTLQLDIIHYTGVNILDDVSPSDFIVVDTMELELLPNELINIPLDDLEEGYIISIHTNVKITHDKPIIPDIIQSISITGDPSIIQTGEYSELYATGYSNGGVPVGAGHTVHFFEKLEPTINVSASQSIIQTNDTTEIYAKVKDSDGSLATNVKVHFYEEE